MNKVKTKKEVKNVKKVVKKAKKAIDVSAIPEKLKDGTILPLWVREMIAQKIVPAPTKEMIATAQAVINEKMASGEVLGGQGADTAERSSAERGQGAGGQQAEPQAEGSKAVEPQAEGSKADGGLEKAKAQAEEMEESEMNALLKRFYYSMEWQAYTRYINARLQLVTNSLISTDPYKDATKMARDQGIRLGLIDLTGYMVSLLNLEKQQEEQR